MNISIERKTTLNRGSLVAYVDVCIENTVVIHGCRIISSNNGRFVSVPSKKSDKDGKYYDHVTFKTKNLKDEFNHLVISAYDGNAGAPRPAPKAPDPEDDLTRPATPKSPENPGAVDWNE